MKNNFKNYFNYTSSERKGALTLVVILFLVLSGYWLIDLFKSDSSFQSQNLSEGVRTFLNSENNTSETFVEIEYFPFNPNQIGLEAWVKLGFSEKQALSIMKYREKGGFFYKKEDLKRLYVVNDSLYNVLAPFIQLENKKKNRSYVKSKTKTCYFVKLVEDSKPIYEGFSALDKVVCNKENGLYSYYIGGFSNKKEADKQLNTVKLNFGNASIIEMACNSGFVINKTKSDKRFVKKEKYSSNSLRSELKSFKIDINSADTTALKSLKGIGSYYAKRIVKYRKALGGFITLSQLKEVYGILPETIDQNSSRLLLDSLNIVKININTCEAVDLKKHPYVNWNIANSIVQIRKSHGAYSSIEEIKKSDLVNDKIYRKIAPYLKIE